MAVVKPQTACSRLRGGGLRSMEVRQVTEELRVERNLPQLVRKLVSRVRGKRMSRIGQDKSNVIGGEINAGRGRDMGGGECPCILRCEGYLVGADPPVSR